MKNKLCLVLFQFSAVFLLSLLTFAAPSPLAQNPAEKIYKDEPNTTISNAAQLTFEGSKSGEGYYSVDGKKMIFQSERYPGNPFYQMYVMDLQTGKSHLVSTGKGKTTCGWIHPSMKKLMFSSTHLDPDWKKKQDEELESRKKPVKGRYSWSFDDKYEIFSADMDGKHLKQLTHSPGYDAEGSYSPDGKWIVFASNRAGYTEKLSPEDQKMFEKDPSYMMDIYRMKEDGTQVQRLTDAKGYDGGPFYRADGKKITWRRFATNGATAEIYTMNADGSDQKQVTHMGVMSWAPFYHPSGDYIVFASSALGFSNFELFIVDSEGLKTPVRVTFQDGFDGLASFSPDGRKITWSHRNEKGESQIYIADWDDAQARRLLGLPAKDLKPGDLASGISAENARKIVNYLASPAFGGRKTGSAEEKIYTQKIADLFKSFGLKGGAPDGSYFQKFDFTSGVNLGENNQLDFVGHFRKSLQVQKDYGVLSFSKIGKFAEAPVVFVGYGIKAPATDKVPAYDSYKNADVKGKWVLAFKDIPENVPAEVRHHLNTYSRIQHKVTVAKNEGALGIIFVDAGENTPEDFSKIKFEGTLSESSLAVLRLHRDTLKELLKLAGQDWKVLSEKLAQGEIPDPVIIPSTYIHASVHLDFDKSTGINVIAKLPVPGSALAELIAAHGDHLGHGDSGSSLAKGDERNEVHPGADDNASGVAGVIELAKYFSQQLQKKPSSLHKDLYFAVWSGEEIGLLGSSAFIKEWNEQKKKKIPEVFETNLNMDMIGRLQDKLQLQGAASGNNWGPFTEEVSLRQQMPMTLQNDPYLPTDSMSFYLAGIPAVNFFTGSHAEYHTPQDRAETLNYPGHEKVVKVVADYAQTLANNKDAVMKYNKVEGNPQNKLEGRSFRIYLGTIPDYTQEGIQGVKISGVSKGSPAESAGLKAKDLIVEFDGIKIENIYDYVYTLQAVKPDVETRMKVKRGDEMKELKIVPKLKE